MSSPGAIRSEVLSLYREILRTARVFRGQKDASGSDWMPRLLTSARHEFQSARDLTDPVEISRRLVVGRDALYQIHEKVSFHIAPLNPRISRCADQLTYAPSLYVCVQLAAKAAKPSKTT